MLFLLLALSAASVAENKPLPEIGAKVTMEEIKAICLKYKLPDLWKKISSDPPIKPFLSDGCTGWFDDWRGKSLYSACFLHDLKYWSGYPRESVARLRADAELMLDVAEILQDTVMAETMFQGVRVGGTGSLKTPFSWGFGRDLD